MSKHVMTKAVRQYLSKIGAKGGKARGRAKLRGDRSYYASIARKRWQRPEAEPGK